MAPNCVSSPWLANVNQIPSAFGTQNTKTYDLAGYKLQNSGQKLRHAAVEQHHTDGDVGVDDAARMEIENRQQEHGEAEGEKTQGSSTSAIAKSWLAPTTGDRSCAIGLVLKVRSCHDYEILWVLSSNDQHNDAAETGKQQVPDQNDFLRKTQVSDEFRGRDFNGGRGDIKDKGHKHVRVGSV